MPKHDNGPFTPHRLDWRFDSNWRTSQNNQQAKHSDKQDNGSTESNKPQADSKTDKSYYEGPVKSKKTCPVEVFRITLGLIEQMTNEAAE